MKGRLMFSISVAAMLWFLMFSPWTSGLSGFWVEMSAAAVILTLLALRGLSPQGRPSLRNIPLRTVLRHLALGISIAFALWGVFLVGDKLSGMMFDFARPQVDDVYAMKDGVSPLAIALLLLFIIGPAEEFFWRGYVQRTLSLMSSPTGAMIVTAVIYALVHVWSFNFMLVMAALVAGCVWGLIYRLRPSLLPVLIVSHAVWDALVFVILPI